MNTVSEIISAYSGLTIKQSMLLMAFIFASLAFLGWFISSYGIQTKWFTIGGQKKENNNIFHDTGLREEIKRKIDEIDADTINNLYDLARQVSRDLNNMLHSGHCYFTLYEVSDTFKDALKAKIRRNNLKNKLQLSNRNLYVEQLVSIIQEEYNDVRMKAMSATCKDIYPDFNDIRKDVRVCIEYFFDRGNIIECLSCEKKIATYEQYVSQFRIKKLQEKYCKDPMEKNKKYLENLKKQR